MPVLGDGTVPAGFNGRPLRYERIHRSGKKSGGQEQLPAEAGAGLPVAPGSFFRSQSQGLCLRSQLIARL